MTTKKLAILGSTGSIGTQTLDVIAQHQEHFSVVALAAGTQVERLIAQVHQFHPKVVCVADRALAQTVRLAVPSHVRVVYGDEGLIDVATVADAQIVVSALVGSRGCIPTLAAIEAGKTIALANKEVLVMAGKLIMQRAQEKGVAIIPVDSEHAAIFQALHGEPISRVACITLTASGGALRHVSREALKQVTVEQALKHPNWSMGAKVTIDSATMANKGLEVIEAHWLFGIDYDRIAVVIHPESIIHSYVEFIDRNVLAQLSMPDMRIPIQYALTFPQRVPALAPRLDMATIGALTFQPLDNARFPMFSLATAAGRMGGVAPTVFNAANEVAVERFLAGTLTMDQIESLVEFTLARHEQHAQPDWDTIVAYDTWARATARQHTYHTM